MDIHDRLLSLNPHLTRASVQRHIEGGERYVAQFDRLPPHDRENVVFFFAAYSLTDSQHYKTQIRRGIDAVLAPWYTGAGGRK